MKSRNKRILCKPRRLQAGDTIALVCPGAFLDEAHIRASTKALQKLGFCVVRSPRIEKKAKRDGYFASTDRERADEIDWAFSEPGVRAVWACRAGYGSMRLTRFFTPQKIKNWKPKIFIGYSDVTYFHQWIQNQLGWVTFHGPLVGYMNEGQIKKTTRDLLDLGTQKLSVRWPRVQSIRAGRARGQLVGGNLCMLRTSGPAALPRRPLILAIEDVHEEFYQIDRMIWSLIDAGYRDYIQGIILGHFHECGRRDSKTFGWSRVQDSLRHLTDGPIWTGAPFGHGLREQAILPLGLHIEMSSSGRWSSSEICFS